MKFGIKILATAASLSLPLSSIALAQSVTGYELNPNYNVRSEPNFESKKVGKVGDLGDESLKIEPASGKEASGWLKVTRPNGGEGYIKAEARKAVQLNPTFIIRSEPSLVTGKRVNIVGNTKSDVLTGEEKVTKEAGKTILWKGVVADGQHAWVAAGVTKEKGQSGETTSPTKLPKTAPLPVERPADLKTTQAHLPKTPPLPVERPADEQTQLPKPPVKVVRDQTKHAPSNAAGETPVNKEGSKPVVAKAPVPLPPEAPRKPVTLKQTLAGAPAVTVSEKKKVAVQPLKPDATQPAKLDTNKVAIEALKKAPKVPVRDTTKVAKAPAEPATAAPAKPPLAKKLASSQPVAVVDKLAAKTPVKRAPEKVVAPVEPVAAKTEVVVDNKPWNECAKSKTEFFGNPRLVKSYDGINPYVRWTGTSDVSLFNTGDYQHVTDIDPQADGRWKLTIVPKFQELAKTFKNVDAVTYKTIEICATSKNKHYIIFDNKKIALPAGAPTQFTVQDAMGTGTFTRTTNQ